MEQWLQHTSDCKYDPTKATTDIGLQGSSNPCTCGLDEFKKELHACHPDNLKAEEGDIISTDLYCRIKTSTPEQRTKSFKSIEWMGTQCAERLLDEKILEIRKYESGNKTMTHCAVVMCSRRVLHSIPRNILERMVQS